MLPFVSGGSCSKAMLVLVNFSLIRVFRAGGDLFALSCQMCIGTFIIESKVIPV